MAKKKCRYYYYEPDPPCASCGIVIEPEEVRDIRETIESCTGDVDNEKWRANCHSGYFKSCVLVFHINCWKLFIKHFNSGAIVPFDKLAKVVEEAPWPNYQGVPIGPLIDNRDRKNVRYIGLRRGARSFPKAESMTFEISPKEEAQSSDSFRRLPLEIRFEIAYLLPTADYLNSRLASRAMVHIYHYQEYWKTRFLIHRERGYLNYLLEGRRQDWRVMYHCTKKMKYLTMPLRYRRLHWLHNEWIKDRCMMFGGPITTLPGSNPRLDGLLWDKAAGQVQCDRLHKCGPYPIAPIPVGLCKRCRGVHHLSPTQTILIPTETVEIAVSVLAEDEHTFITGFKLVYRDISPSVYFGYQIPHKQIKVDLRGQALAGFEVFAGEGGIQAIRPIFDDKHGKCHSIIGKPNATCQSVLLTPVGVIRAFSAVFDDGGAWSRFNEQRDYYRYTPCGYRDRLNYLFKLEFAFATSESVSKY